MLTFRKALIAAAFILTIIYLMRSTPPNAAPTPMKPMSASKYNIKPSSSFTESTPTQLDEQSSSRIIVQNPKAMLDKPLRDRLGYQFPYFIEDKFPAYIWQTWKTTPGSVDFEDLFRPFEESWTEKHPGFVHEVITDAVAVLLIQSLYAFSPEVHEAYNALPVPVLKADFFRYLILLARGGIYADIDTQALRPATEWLPRNFNRSSIGLVVGIEADSDRDDWAIWYSRRIQFCQWTIEAKAGHPVLRDIVATITEDILRMEKLKILTVSKMDKSIVEFTGSAIWTDAIFRYFNSTDHSDMKDNKQNISWRDITGMETPRIVKDVVILPITSFNSGSVQQRGVDDDIAFVKHHFKASFSRSS